MINREDQVTVCEESTIIRCGVRACKESMRWTDLKSEEVGSIIKEEIGMYCDAVKRWSNVKLRTRFADDILLSKRA